MPYPPYGRRPQPAPAGPTLGQLALAEAMKAEFDARPFGSRGEWTAPSPQPPQPTVQSFAIPAPPWSVLYVPDEPEPDHPDPEPEPEPAAAQEAAEPEPEPEPEIVVIGALPPITIPKPPWAGGPPDADEDEPDEDTDAPEARPRGKRARQTARSDVRRNWRPT